MIPINQSISDPTYGDCVAACVASILEVPLSAVPNFSMAPTGLFHHLFEQTMFAYGWKLEGNAIHDGVIEWKDGSINGYYLCSVPSKNFDCNHSVIIDKSGVVVHDPSPKKNYLGDNLFSRSRIDGVRGESALYHYFHIFSKRTDDDWKSIEKCMEHHKNKSYCRGAFDKSVTKCSDGEVL